MRVEKNLETRLVIAHFHNLPSPRKLWRAVYQRDKGRWWFACWCHWWYLRSWWVYWRFGDRAQAKQQNTSSFGMHFRPSPLNYLSLIFYVCDRSANPHWPHQEQQDQSHVYEPLMNGPRAWETTWCEQSQVQGVPAGLGPWFGMVIVSKIQVWSWRSCRGSPTHRTCIRLRLGESL